MLHNAIKDRGLGELVSQSAEEAMQKLEDQNSSGVTVDNFEPLLLAHNALLTCAIEEVGSQQFFAQHVGSAETPCPLCYLIETAHDAAYEGWIDQFADHQVTAWRELGNS